MPESGTLYVETRGQGPDVVLLHGWGLNAHVWDAVAETLAVDYRVSCVDLPGHGRSAGMPMADLDTLLASLHQDLPAQAVWVGWSLGGVIATQYTLRFPQAVTRLITVATNARFTQAPSWPHAVAPGVLEAFAEGLKEDYLGTLKRFLALQFRGVSNAQADLRRLRASLSALPPSAQALDEGLNLLRSSDLRAQLAQIACPVRFILGEFDALVPASAGPAMLELLPEGARCQLIPGAGHAPFLSCEAAFLRALKGFLHD